MIAEGLFAHLAGDTAVSAIVAARIYPLVIPQKIPNQAAKVPCIVYQFTGARFTTGYCGTDPHRRSSLQLDCYAINYPEAQALAEAVKDCLLDFSGMLGGIANVHAIMLADQSDMLDLEPGLHRVWQSWTVWHVEN